MNNHYDVIIVGGGHNGLTAAGYLGKTGLKTLVLEKREMVGGACVTEEIHPGYQISTTSYVVSLLQSKIINDLQLKAHGYETLPIESSLKICGDNFLFLTGDETNDRREMLRYSSKDYDAMIKFDAMVQKYGMVLRNQMLREPPQLDADFTDLISIARLGWDIRKLSSELRHRLIQMLTSSAYDLIERWFDSAMIKNMYAAACFSGGFASLRQPGSAIPFFHLAIGELDGKLGAWGAVKGGMGAITKAMASFAQSQGVEIRTSAGVKKILIDQGKTIGVQLENGDIINGRCVMANTDPKRTFLKLIDQDQLDSEFVKDIQQIRMGSGSLKLNLALNGMPNIKFQDSLQKELWQKSLISIFTDIEGLEANFFAAAQGKLPDKPCLEIAIPSALDDSLAPSGHHVMGIVAKYYPFQLAGGQSWDNIKDDVTEQIVDYIAQVMPNLKDLIVKQMMISPLDYEREYGLTEGDIFHGRHDIDQLFSMRPHPRAAQYRTPVKNLYLCGSGSHPGGGVSGAPGHNAARRVIADLK